MGIEHRKSNVRDAAPTDAAIRHNRQRRRLCQSLPRSPDTHQTPHLRAASMIFVAAANATNIVNEVPLKKHPEIA